MCEVGFGIDKEEENVFEETLKVSFCFSVRFYFYLDYAFPQRKSTPPLK